MRTLASKRPEKYQKIPNQKSFYLKPSLFGTNNPYQDLSDWKAGNFHIYRPADESPSLSRIYKYYTLDDVALDYFYNNLKTYLNDPNNIVKTKGQPPNHIEYDFVSFMLYRTYLSNKAYLAILSLSIREYFDLFRKKFLDPDDSWDLNKLHYGFFMMGAVFLGTRFHYHSIESKKYFLRMGVKRKDLSFTKFNTHVLRRMYKPEFNTSEKFGKLSNPSLGSDLGKEILEMSSRPKKYKEVKNTGRVEFGKARRRHGQQ